MNASVEDRALELIKASPKGVLQSDLWKDLDIDSRKCSRVVAKLEEEGKVKRTWETVSGTRTYRLSFVPPKKEAPKKEYRFDLVMAEDEVAPCVGCTYECEPDYCPDLGNWIELLAIDEAKRAKKEGTQAEPSEVPEEMPEEAVKVAHKPVKAEEHVEKPLKASKKAEKVEKPVKVAPKRVEKAVEKPAVKPAEKPAKATPKRTMTPEKPVVKQAEKLVKAPSKPAEKPEKPAPKKPVKEATKKRK